MMSAEKLPVETSTPLPGDIIPECGNCANASQAEFFSNTFSERLSLMTRNILLSLALSAVAVCPPAFAQAQKNSEFDVQHYKIDAELIPASIL
jgi:hypothetical protein